MAQTMSVTEAPPGKSATRPAKPKRRVGFGFRLLLLLGLVLVIAVWFAPAIVAKTSLRQRIPKLLFPTYPGSIGIGSASLDWLSPVIVYDLHAEDAEGHPFLDIKQFSTSEPLWKLATQPSKLGRLKLVEPVVSVSFRNAGSNLEDVLEKLLSGPSKKSPDFELEIAQATVELEHKLATLTSTVKPISLIMASKKGVVEELELTIGQVPGSGDAELSPPSDWLAFKFGSEPTQDGVAMSPGSKHIRLKAQGWKVDRFLPALARCEPGAELAGEINADVRSQIDSSDSTTSWTEREWSWDGRITLQKLRLTGMNLLNRDQVQIDSVAVSGRLAAQHGKLSMDRFQILTDVGEMTATGDLAFAEMAGVNSLAALSTILSDHDYAIQGHIDLHRLAALLPGTLRVRDGTRITSGQLQMQLKSETRDAMRQWTGTAGIDGLAAINNSQPVSWNEPLRLSLQAHRNPDGITVDRLQWQSDFLTLSGNGTLSDARFSGSGDLSKLEANLQRFIDFGLQKLSGAIKADGRIQRADDNKIALQSTLTLDNFHWQAPGNLVWQEPHLVLSLNGSGHTEDGVKLKVIDQGEVRLISGNDLLSVALQQAIPVSGSSGPPAAKIKLEGDLRTWQARMQPFFSLPGWQLGGQAKIEATVSKEAHQIDVEKFTANVTAFEARNAAWWIKDPRLEVTTAGICSTDRSEWVSQQSTIAGTSFSCQINDFVLALKRDGGLARVTGEAAFRGDLDKISRWKTQATYYAAGTLEGRASLTEQDSVISVDSDATIEKLVVADLETMQNQQLHWVALWREPRLRVKGKGSYETRGDHLMVDSASVQADGLSVNASGKLEQISTAQQIDLSGELIYDWDVLNQRLGDAVRKNIQLKGKDQGPFHLQGTLANLSSGPAAGATGTRPSDLNGNAEVGWQSAVLAGMPVGPAKIVARMDQGNCQFSPIDTTIANGRLHLTPQVRLDNNPSLLVLPAEKVLNQVQLSRELCATWLKFVAPMVADATQVEGKLSLEVTGGALPLAAPKTGELGGVLEIHRAQVHPGAQAQQVLGLLNQVQSVLQGKPGANPPRDRVWMEMPEQAVNFQLANGRVTNQGVTIVIGDAVIKSSGSVGLIDETLDIVMQIPIRDEWVADKKILANLKGQTLQVPIRGTLSQPQIDSRVLGDLDARIGGSAIDGVLENKLDDIFNKKLNKFLPGKK